VSLINYMRMI